ncbi:MAG TPA: UDP-2,3-diacylglucosamine diphosphatase [Xanthomonadaceae bacterium]
MTTLFVSDLHLDSARPRIVALFRDFLREEAAHADALYILGDLFEYWVGDDDPQPVAGEVIEGLSALAASGVPVFFLRGNRDFLLRDAYAARCGMRILPDPCVIDLYGQPVLLAHGDAMCSDDVAYQAFRRQSREPAWQEQMLAQPLPVRIALAQKARAASIEHQRAVRPDAAADADVHGRTSVAGAGRAGATEDITDVSQATVEATFARYGIATMIHGHTHRPAIHRFEVGGMSRRRIVLGDWYEQGSVLRADADGFSLTAL